MLDRMDWTHRLISRCRMSHLLIGGFLGLGCMFAAFPLREYQLHSLHPDPGTPAADIRIRFGEPDTVLRYEDGSEIWYYSGAFKLFQLKGIRFDQNMRTVFYWSV